MTNTTVAKQIGYCTALCATASLITVPAFARVRGNRVEPHVDGASHDVQAVVKTGAAAHNASDADARSAMLEAKIEALQAQLDLLKMQIPKATPSWKAAPQWADGDSGFTFKPKGVLQFDAGYVALPRDVGGTVGSVFGGFGAGGVNTNNLGTGYRARRVTIGADGTIPGGFGYRVEFELSQSSVNYEDLVLTYQRKGSPILVTAGYHYPLSSLELMTSHRFTSFMERSSMNDAFGYGRRLGLSVAYLDPEGHFTLTGGLWGEDIANTNIARTGWQASLRGTYSPHFGETQAHIGFNYQHRVPPRDAQNVRYRARPLTQLTDQRFIDTGRIAADGDDILGFEAAAAYKRLHFAAEAQKVWVRGYSPGRVFGINNGTGGTSAFLNSSPSFGSGYAEIGFFVTDDTRGYKGGKWDRTKVHHPVGKGGIGAVQINGRIDYTGLSDEVGAGVITPGSLNFVNGGKQTGYELSLIWLPTDYVKFMAQYALINVSGGPAATAAFSDVQPIFYNNSYTSDAVMMRAQLDF